MREVPDFPTTVRSRERAMRAKGGKLTLQVCRDCGWGNPTTWP
ncbi:MAG: hypothetical protein WD795_04565 [Woeseia sp.]